MKYHRSKFLLIDLSSQIDEVFNQFFLSYVEKKYSIHFLKLQVTSEVIIFLQWRHNAQGERYFVLTKYGIYMHFSGYKALDI